MVKVVLHAPWCGWRTGSECQCGGNPRAIQPEALCAVCTDAPCSCARYATATP